MGWGTAAIETLFDTAGAIPGISEGASAIATTYHAGHSIYDSLTGNQKGAEDELSAAGNSAVGLIPAVGEGYHAVHAVANAFQTGQRLAGASDEEAPTVSEGMADVVRHW